MGRDIPDSPIRGRGSPRRRSPSRRERSPARHKSSHKTSSPPREKLSSRTKSPRHDKLRSPERSLSPRTNRSRRVQAERESEKVSEKEHRRDRDWEKDERAAKRERQVPSERKERGEGEDRRVSRSRHERSSSPSDRHHKSRHRSRSPHRDRDMSEVKESRRDEPRNGDIDSVAKMKAAEEALTTKEKEKPSFELSGKLAAETNRVRGITLLFNEPPDAKKPDMRWRLYVFKGGEVLNEPLYVHRQSCYLFGRERRIADIPTDHPSCSKQHAVLQYRQVDKEQPDGTMLKQVRPYVMDLGSTNGTFINDNRLEAQRYYELLEKDNIKFGNSSREYVLLHENSAT